VLAVLLLSTVISSVQAEIDFLDTGMSDDSDLRLHGRYDGREQ